MSRENSLTLHLRLKYPRDPSAARPSVFSERRLSRRSLDWITTTAPHECRVNLILRRPRLGAKGAAMKIIGCDFHPSFQQIAMVDTETGELTAQRVTLSEAVEFYRNLPGPARVGMEACGNTGWFERLLAELGHELWLGDAGRIRATEVRKQKTDRRDAELLLRLMLENRFPRLWIPSQEQRDLRQLLIHRHKLVGMRRQVKNQLQHLALNQGVQQKRKLWTRAGRKLLEELPLTGWTARRREELLELLDSLDRSVGELD